MLCLSFNPHINILAVGKGRTAHSPANITMSRINVQMEYCRQKF
jgi:hypothetical protein